MLNNYDCEYIKNHFKISKLKKKKRGILLFFLVLFLIISLITTYIVKIINPIIIEFSSAEAEKFLVTSSNLAVHSVIDDYKYEDLFNIEYDKNEDIIAITTNQKKINEISNLLVLKAQEIVDQQSKIGVKIPIGNFTGIGFLIGKGFPIQVFFNPIGNINAEIKTEFLEAGINQTIHRLYLVINGKVSLIFPFANKNIKSTVQVLIFESLIVGKVPNTYLGFSSIKEFLTTN